MRSIEIWEVFELLHQNRQIFLWQPLSEMFLRRCLTKLQLKYQKGVIIPSKQVCWASRGVKLIEATVVSVLDVWTTTQTGILIIICIFGGDWKCQASLTLVWRPIKLHCMQQWCESSACCHPPGATHWHSCSYWIHGKYCSRSQARFKVRCIKSHYWTLGSR